MNATITIDKAGRIVLPKQIREELQLRPGDAIELEASNDQVVLRPARGKGRMRRKCGIWVLSTGKPIAASVVDETIRRIRREREQTALGTGR